MLILPLHRPLTRASFPLVTALLVLANVLVFTLLQSGDDAARMQAVRHYVDSGLAERELPAWLEHLGEDGVQAGAELQAVPEPVRAMVQAERIAMDEGFAELLARGDIEGYDPQWREARAEYERLRERVFTDRHVLRYQRVDLGDALSSAFLHANAAHLMGNMLFLALLGLMVEPVLGAARMLAVYLLGALAAAAAAWAWHWGESGAMLGASGAVAAIMGATSVLWAGRRVRVFYWFFVVFDYVRVPALWLLPAWLGWELLQLAINTDAGVAFEAHAGGLAGGALLALSLRQLGWWHPQALEVDEPGDSDAAVLAQAQAHLGRLDTAKAQPVLRDLLARQPDSLPVRIALFRCARYDGDATRAASCGADVLARTARDSTQRQEQVGVLEEMDAAGLAVPIAARLAVVRRLLAAGEPATARAALERADTGTSPAEPSSAEGGPLRERLAQAWLELGVALHGRGDTDAAHAAWRRVATGFPGSPQAGKAGFLLSAHGEDVAASPDYS